MKDTREINEQIELARQSGYNEACFVKEKEFLKEIKKFKEKFNEQCKDNSLLKEWGEGYNSLLKEWGEGYNLGYNEALENMEEELKKGVLKE